jgi:hypothetical protein
MSEDRAPSLGETGDSPTAVPEPPLPDSADVPGRPESSGALLSPEASDRLEAEDRKKPIPGGEPDCPRCETKMTRRVERHPAPRGGSSPFRVRLVCPSAQCGAWTVYDW